MRTKNMMKTVLSAIVICLFLISDVNGEKETKLQKRKSNDFDASKEIELFCSKFGWKKKCDDGNTYQPVVAFTAILGHNVALGQRSAVIYDRVLTNIGKGYNVHTGHFKVPTSGLYSISVSMMGNPNNGIHLNLVRNGIELVRLWTQSGRYELSSQTINVPLRKTDHLWVRQHSGTNLYGLEHYNVFSATLLRRGNFK